MSNINSLSLSDNIIFEELDNNTSNLKKLYINNLKKDFIHIIKKMTILKVKTYKKI